MRYIFKQTKKKKKKKETRWRNSWKVQLPEDIARPLSTKTPLKQNRPFPIESNRTELASDNIASVTFYIALSCVVFSNVNSINASLLKDAHSDLCS